MSLAVHPKDIVEASESPLLASAEHWERKPLGEVATILNGYAFSSKLFSRTEGVPLIRIRDISKGTTTERFKGQFEERYLIRSGDLLVGMDGEFNVARWSGSHALLNQRVMKIEPKPGILDIEFLFHLLPGYLQAIHDLTSSTTVKHLSSRDVERLPIPVPKIEEQRRIAAQIAALVELVESSKGRLATIPVLLKKFRQSVLAAAYDCSILLPFGETIVTECSLGDIIRKIEAGKSFKAEGHPPRNGVPGVIKVSAMTWGRFNPLESKQLIPGTKPNPATEIQTGDLLFSRANTEELVGATVLVEATPPNLFLSDKSLRLVPVERICKRWLNAALSSPQVRDHFAEIATGTSNSMRNISQSKLLRTPILLPEFEDQKRIADRVESLFALVDSIESRLADATAQVERTTQAILAKAFRGEL